MNKEWNSSPVMKEFIKIAAESGLITTNFKPKGEDFVGNPSRETPVKGYRRYEPTEEYNVTKVEDLVQKAHPKKIQVADAMGEGSVVENLNEQQKKSIDVATKMPGGTLIGVHAKLINELIKIANKFDNLGKYKEAVLIDQTIERLTYFPFVYSHLYKKAWIWPVVNILVGIFAPAVIDWFRTKPGPTKYSPRVLRMPEKKLVGFKGRAASLVMAGVGVLGLLGNKITSLQEGIREDTQDLIDALSKTDSKSAKKALEILNSFAPQLLQSDLGNEKGVKDFINITEKINSSLPSLEKYISIYTKLEDPSVTGFGLSSRIEAKFEDFKTSLQQASKIIAQLTSVGAKTNENAISDLRQTSDISLTPNKNSNIQSLQQILFNRGFPLGEKWEGEISGVIDNKTIIAAKELEEKLDRILQDFAQKEGISGSFKGQIVQDNNIIIDPYKLSKILTLTEKYISNKKSI